MLFNCVSLSVFQILQYKIGICYYTKIYDALTIAKVQMLNKPYIHYIYIKVMNNVSRKPLD